MKILTGYFNIHLLAIVVRVNFGSYCDIKFQSLVENNNVDKQLISDFNSGSLEMV